MLVWYRWSCNRFLISDVSTIALGWCSVMDTEDTGEEPNRIFYHLKGEAKEEIIHHPNAKRGDPTKTF